MSPTLRAYQEAGVKHLAGRLNALLFDTMGLGKSAQALTAARQAKVRRIVIVAPLATALGWTREVDLWWPKMSENTVILRRKDPWPTDADECYIVIVPYTDLAHRFYKGGARGIRRAITEPPPIDLLIMDEAHTLRNGNSTKMGKGFHTLRKAAIRLWGMTASPMPNGRPIELLPLLQLCGAFNDANAQMTVGKYQDTFCRQYSPFAPQGYDYLGVKNLDQLKAFLTSTKLILQRSAEDVPGELPELQRQILPLDASPILRSMEERSIRECAADPRSELPPLEELSAYRAALATSKAEMVIDYLRTEWPADKPAVIFVHHREAGAKLARAFDCDFASGGDTAARRQEKVDRFSKADGPQFLVASMGACGTGMNGMHKRTTTAIFAEAAWDIGTIDQAEGRVRRIGGIASHMALAIYCVVADAFEEHLVRTVLRKREAYEETFARQGYNERSAFSVSYADKADVKAAPCTVAWVWKHTRLSTADRPKWYAVATPLKKGGTLPPIDAKTLRDTRVRAYHADGWSNHVILKDAVLTSTSELWFTTTPVL